MQTSTHADAHHVYRVLCDGGVALIPLDVGYTLLARHEVAIRRIAQLPQGRAATFLTVVDDTIFDELVAPIEPPTRRWIEETTAITPLAIVARLDPYARLLAGQGPYARAQIAQQGTITTLHGAGALGQAIAARAQADGALIIAVPAAVGGAGASFALAEVPAVMRAEADVILDRGRSWYANALGLGVTVLDLATGTFPHFGINHAQIATSWSRRRNARRVA